VSEILDLEGLGREVHARHRTLATPKGNGVPRHLDPLDPAARLVRPEEVDAASLPPVEVLHAGRGSGDKPAIPRVGLVLHEPRLRHEQVVEVVLQEAITGLPRGGRDPLHVHVANAETHVRSERFSSVG
jgi:hypothetical protein